MTLGRSDSLSDGVELPALRGLVARVEAELLAVRAARDQLAGEVERLRVDNQRLRARVGALAAPADGPMHQSREAHHPARPLHSP
jgi:regulator of replication initiation timing